ncbi:hypothetical protein R2F61_01325 [Mollicutes bacterium LVI A0078]|nr:hypothetical protein RZE84_01320 [Mollicutes bacterium LVI A0075]WOO91219.1 hypothetical protein R2F61_01325 [Mollicutes bacterium LVI A0078]
MRLQLSKVSYFLILVTLMVSIDSILYFNIENLPGIIMYIIVLLIPLVRLIKHVFTTNTRIVDNKIPKLVYDLIDLGLLIMIVAQISLLVDSISWLISGNPAVVNNISNSGFWIVSMLIYIAVHNLGNRQKLIRNSAYVLAFFDIILIPLVLIYIITSSYGGLLAGVTLGQLDMTMNTIIKIFPLLSILLFARNKKVEEDKISAMLYPALWWMIFIFALTVIAVSGSTLEIPVVNDEGYVVKFFQNLNQAHILNAFDYDVTTVVAGYQFLNSMLALLLLTLVKDALYERSSIYIRKNEYIADADMKGVYKNRKARHNIMLFAILTIFIVVISPTLYDLTVLVSNLATFAMLVINFVFIAIMGFHFLKQTEETKFIKFLSVYLMLISSGLIAVYFL